jgi:hypothetical protein
VRHTGENENKKSEKDTDVVQTVYDRPKRRARVTAKGRSDKKVVSTKRRCTSSTPHDPATRAHGRHGSNQPRPEHPRASLGHGIFNNMPYAKWKYTRWASRGATNSQPLHLAVPLGLWRTSLVLVLLLSFVPHMPLILHFWAHAITVPFKYNNSHNNTNPFPFPLTTTAIRSHSSLLLSARVLYHYP